MWHWKMSNTELVYSLVGFDTPTSGPTLTFSYLYSLYPTPLPHLSASHSAIPTTPITFTSLHLYNSPAICHNLQFTTNAYIQSAYHLFYSSISTCVATIHTTLFSAYQPYYTQCILLCPMKSLQLFSTTLTALRATHH